MYLAHISDEKREQLLSEHLNNTAVLAGEFASSFGCKEWGKITGLLHDIGKYSNDFQRRIRGDNRRVDHSTAGAIEINGMGYRPLAYCIAGHHAGLPDGGSIIDMEDASTLCGRLKKCVKDYKAYKSEINITKPTPPNIQIIGKGGFTMSFFTRMIYSCLVDADFIDTERFMSNSLVERSKSDSIDTLYERLVQYTNPWLINNDKNLINQKRTEILQCCYKKGNEKKGLYSLTVPTGGGKTVSSLAFALQHAKKNNMDRVIYVIPYTSIIEQNAAVFSKILGSNNVLEHHSNVNYDDESDNDQVNKKRLASENWDVPIIVTTNVQFFESIFANKSSKCRKLHNMSNSVIIFDEAQMLPNDYLMPCVRAMSELIYNYHSTLVLCTATQPSLQKLFSEKIKCHEIYEEYEKEFECFKRVLFEQLGMVSDSELKQKLNQYSQVLCIVNTRKSAQEIYESMDSKGSYHLSTLMYPAHRRKILEEIRQRLREGKACRVIATSLIEAGVDVDFPVVYRELAGTDSIIQAAGRCNREGKSLKENSKVYVFELQTDDRKLPDSLKQPIAITKQTLEKFHNLLSLEAIQYYFDQLHYLKGDALDIKHIVDMFEESKSGNFPFLTTANIFRLIESNTKSLIINNKPEVEALLKTLRMGGHSRNLLRKLGQYSINIGEYYYKLMSDAGMIEILDEEMAVLKSTEAYTESTGLDMKLNIKRGDAFFV